MFKRGDIVRIIKEPNGRYIIDGFAMKETLSWWGKLPVRQTKVIVYALRDDGLVGFPLYHHSDNELILERDYLRNEKLKLLLES